MSKLVNGPITAKFTSTSILANLIGSMSKPMVFSFRQRTPDGSIMNLNSKDQDLKFIHLHFKGTIVHKDPTFSVDKNNPFISSCKLVIFIGTVHFFTRQKFGI